MNDVFGLLCYAAVTVLGAPLFLTTGRWVTRWPRLALSLWLVAFLSGLTALVASMIWSVALALELHKADTANQHAWLGPTAIVLLCWGSLAGFGALIALVLSKAEPLTASHRQAVQQFTLLAASSTYRTTEVGNVSVSFIDSTVPVAICLPGSDRCIVISSSLERELTPGQLRAVIEHERTHLIQRHASLNQLAALNHACLPALLGAREFRCASTLLIELIADDRAARICGVEDAAGALATLGTTQVSESMMLRSRRLVQHPPKARRHARKGQTTAAAGYSK